MSDDLKYYLRGKKGGYICNATTWKGRSLLFQLFIPYIADAGS